MNIAKSIKFYLWYFGWAKVALIGYLRPKIIDIDDQRIVIKIKLNRRSKNHLNSMYFGALAIGADIAGGLHGFYHAGKQQLKASLVFKSFHADFIKRPESDVYFVCEMGEQVREMLLQSQAQQKRINRNIDINAYTHYLEQPEKVASFVLELSIKV